MKHIYAAIFSLVQTSTLLFGQIGLLPHIGLNGEPNDQDTVCPIPLFLGGGFDTTGYSAGESVPDFTLYGPNGDIFSLSGSLAQGRPVLLIAGSYTCPVFRNKAAAINQVVATYGNAIEAVVVYTLEAHPTDPSPYFGTVNVTAANQQAGILYAQPTTYGARKAIVADMASAMPLDAPIYLDGPCNEWWSHFGPAPNNAYLIDTNGRVFAKHDWFNRLPLDIFQDIDDLLGLNNGGVPTWNGSFTYTLSVDSIVRGIPGETLYVSGELRNNSPTEGVAIIVGRLLENVPAGWTTALCTDICNDYRVDFDTVYLLPNATLSVSMDFMTDPLLPGQGMVRMGFRNLFYPNNRFIQNCYASTEATGLFETTSTGAAEQLVRTYPNPCPKGGLLRVSIAEGVGEAVRLLVSIADQQGRIRWLGTQRQGNALLTAQLPEMTGGVYVLSLWDESGMVAIGHTLLYIY